ncbi:MAG: hypothetical protein R3F11_26855 [Verrucomicrobiales bacterium]
MRKLIAAIACLFTGGKDGDDRGFQQSGDSEPDPDAWVSDLVWLDASDTENPFGQEVLDCRRVALGFTSTTSDPIIADSFIRLRSDDGRSGVGALPENAFSVDADLRFPYNGDREDGVIFSAKEMEDKWDFYAYDSRLYIRRSWTGVLLHVAELRYTGSEVVVEKIRVFAVLCGKTCPTRQRTGKTGEFGEARRPNLLQRRRDRINRAGTGGAGIPMPGYLPCAE